MQSRSGRDKCGPEADAINAVPTGGSMRVSHLFTKTLREAPRDAEGVNQELLVRAGFIRQLTAGVYSYLPLGLRVLHKIERIVREEMDRAGGQEVTMPVMQP